MTYSQVVDAYHDDRVQDDDLTQKHYLLFGTLGAEQMPRSTVVRRVGTILLLLFLLPPPL